MQANDGHLVELSEKRIREFFSHGNLNLVSVGDVFQVRECFFQITSMTGDGITAKGISRKEFFDCRNKNTLKGGNG